MMTNTQKMNWRTIFFVLLLYFAVMVVPQYRFPVDEVDSCPKNRSSWYKAGVRLNCSYDENNASQYLCVPNEDKTSLLEFCHDRTMLFYEEGYCLLLSSTGDLKQKNCKEFSHGCPEERYRSSDLFNYSSCLEIDKSYKCFSADLQCIEIKKSLQTTSPFLDIIGAVSIFLMICVILSFIIKKRQRIKWCNIQIQQKRNVILLEGLYKWKKDGNEIDVHGISSKYSNDDRGLFINNFSEDDSGEYQGFYEPSGFERFTKQKKITYPVTIEIKKLKLVGVTFDNSKENIFEETSNSGFVSIWTSKTKMKKPCKVLLTETPSDSTSSFQSTWNLQDPNRNSRLVFILKCAALLSKGFSFSWNSNRTIDVLKKIENFMVEIPHKVEEYKNAASNLEPCSLYKSTTSCFELLSDDLKLETLWIFLNRCRSPIEVFQYILDQRLTTLTKEYFRLEGYIQHVHETYILLPRSVANFYLNSLIIENFEYTGNPWETNDEFDQRTCTVFECIVHYALLTDLPTSDIVLKYFATSGYVEEQGGICINVPAEYNEKVIQKMDVDIIVHKTLKDLDIHEAVSKLLSIPKEVLEWNDERKERFVLEMKKGKVRIHRAKIIVVGCAGAGKTTLVERLKHPDSDEMPVTSSTVGLDVHKNVFHVDGGRLIFSENTFVLNSSSREQQMVTVMDFAGQSAYYACHQVYLTQRAIYLLVTDMSKSMDETVSQIESDDEGTIFAKWKHGDYLSFWLQSIRTYCGEKMPVVLVATHKDKRILDKSFFDEILHSLLEEQDLKKHLSTQRYFEIGANPEDKDKIVDIQKLLLHLLTSKDEKQSYSHWGEFIPSFWLSAEEQLERSGDKIMEVSKMVDRFKRELSDDITGVRDRLRGLWFQLKVKLGLEVSKEITKIHDMLQFFHEIGHILFFDERSLNKVAILDVQWFVDAFKSITMDESQANIVKKSSDSNPWIKDHFPTMKDWKDFYNSGKLPRETLKKFWDSNGDKDLRKHEEIILEYMQRLGILVIGNTFHYIPCVNKMDIEPSRLDSIFSEQNKTSVICFRFKHCLHHFFFQRVVVACMLKWKYLEIDGKIQLFKNIVLLEHKRTGNVIAIGVNKTAIQLLVYSVSRYLQLSDTYKVRNTVENILSSVVKTFHKKVEYEVGFSCMEEDKITENGKGRFYLEKDAIDFTKRAAERKCIYHSDSQHVVNWREKTKYWNKERNLRNRFLSKEERNSTGMAFFKKEEGNDLKNERLFGIQEQVIDIESHLSQTENFQVSDEESKKQNWKKLEKLTAISRNALQIYFDSKLPPLDLEKVLTTFKDDMQKGHYRFGEEQRLILFPGDGSCPLSSTFDITIMYKLLRNYGEDLPVPSQGWGKNPRIGEIKETDDLERIRFYRNKCCHAVQETSVMEKDEFEMSWIDLSQAIMRLSKGKLKADVDNLEKEICA